MATDAELKQIQIDKYTRKQAEQFGLKTDCYSVQKNVENSYKR